MPLCGSVPEKFDAGMEVYHVQGDKKMRLSQPQQMMAQERKIVDEAYAGDIIGVFDPGVFLHRRHASVCLESKVCTMKESPPSHRSILQECVRWIP